MRCAPALKLSVIRQNRVWMHAEQLYATVHGCGCGLVATCRYDSTALVNAFSVFWPAPPVFKSSLYPLHTVVDEGSLSHTPPS